MNFWCVFIMRKLFKPGNLYNLLHPFISKARVYRYFINAHYLCLLVQVQVQVQVAPQVGVLYPEV